MIIISPHLIFPYLTLFYLILPYSTLLYIILHYVTLFYLTVPYLTLFLSFFLIFPAFPLSLSHILSPLLFSLCLTLPFLVFFSVCLTFHSQRWRLERRTQLLKIKLLAKKKITKLPIYGPQAQEVKTNKLNCFAVNSFQFYFNHHNFFAFLMLLPLLLLLYSFLFIVTSTFPSLFLSIFTSTYFSSFSFYTLFFFMIIIGLLKPKPKRPKMDSDGVAIPTPAAPHRDPTPLEVLSRFTIAQDEELPGLVWDLIDEVRDVMRLSRH